MDITEFYDIYMNTGLDNNKVTLSKSELVIMIVLLEEELLHQPNNNLLKILLVKLKQLKKWETS